MDTRQKNPAPPVRGTPSATPPRVSSADILRGAHMVEIDHAGQRYLLRVTRENKLILTK
jgi:hemin uptake protein HemP